jgi:hypothetical protein
LESNPTAQFRPAFVALLVCAGFASSTRAANPIVPNIGLTDPEIRIYDNHAYLYATHDADPKARKFLMNDWWVWRGDDLVNWKKVSVLKPEDTYWKKPSNECWATSSAGHNGKYYFYFSRGRSEIGVVEGDSPAGPWHDPLGRPLIAQGSLPTEARDPGVLQRNNGYTYIVFGTFKYYIARLNDDMISLAETPRRVIVSPEFGPYGNKLDDKPNLFERGGTFYLSWGCYYGMSDNVYGPFAYKDTIIHRDRMEPGMIQPGDITRDRHGDFFELYNQCYFACNDYSTPGSSPYFRNSIISYVHFRDNGEIEPISVTKIGVGEYDASNVIQAANYFKGEGITQKESPDGGFEVRNLKDGSTLAYPNTMNLPANATMSLRLANGNALRGTVEVHRDSPAGPILGSCSLPATGGWNNYATIALPLKNDAGKLDLYLVFHGSGGDLVHFTRFAFK